MDSGPVNRAGTALETLVEVAMRAWPEKSGEG